MLETAVTYCRDRRISTERFRSNLEQTVEDVYAEGRPRSFNDVVAAVEHCVGEDIDESPYADIGDDDRNRICDADSRLHDDWRARIDDFCTVLEEYRITYRQTIRDRGVVSHTDVAYLVDAYFDDRLGNDDDTHRARIRQRYQTRIQSLIIDEAQDVSSIQHAALSHLVTSSARVSARVTYSRVSTRGGTLNLRSSRPQQTMESTSESTGISTSTGLRRRRTGASPMSPVRSTKSRKQRSQIQHVGTSENWTSDTLGSKLIVIRPTSRMSTSRHSIR